MKRLHPVCPINSILHNELKIRDNKKRKIEVYDIILPINAICLYISLHLQGRVALHKKIRYIYVTCFPGARTRGDIPSFPNTPSWHGAQLKAHGQLYLYLYILYDKNISVQQNCVCVCVCVCVYIYIR
jgi:hypothetical protein